MAFDRIGVVGAGAWGTALAQAVRGAGREVLVWAHEAETVAAINDRHENTLFLPGIGLDPAIRSTGALGEMGACDALLLVTPAQHTRAIADQLAPALRDGVPVIICAKGIEQKSGQLLSQVIAETLPGAAQVVLSGPSFAAEVARGLPCAVTLACADESLGADLAHAIGHHAFRPYWANDPVGAQIGGAIKNVLAIAAGIVRGRELGSNAHAALVTRGFAEMVRFGAALGGKAETLSGLSGLGDLLLTCASPQSRNMSLGMALGQGRTLQQVLGSRNSVSEGVYTASAVTRLAADKGLDLPICTAVDDVVSGRRSVAEAIERLLARPLRPER